MFAYGEQGTPCGLEPGLSSAERLADPCVLARGIDYDSVDRVVAGMTHEHSTTSCIYMQIHQHTVQWLLSSIHTTGRSEQFELLCSPCHDLFLEYCIDGHREVRAGQQRAHACLDDGVEYEDEDEDEDEGDL